MAQKFTSKRGALENSANTILAAQRMRDALNIISDLLPENGKRCDKRFYDKVGKVFNLAGLPAKFCGEKIQVFKSMCTGLYEDRFPEGTSCANITLTLYFSNTRGGVMRDVDALRGQIRACAEICANVQKAAESTTPEQIDAFISKYKDLRKDYEDLRDNAPYGVADMMDYLGACPIF